MKLSVLTENTASGKFYSEHGLSYYIESDINILFDTGHSDIFLQNAKKLNIDIDKVDTIVLSHGHWDHGDGLRYISNKKLICHSDVFQKRYRKNGDLPAGRQGENIGLELSFNELKNKFDIVYTRLPFEVSKNIIFLGEVPRNNSFESKTTTFELEDKKDTIKYLKSQDIAEIYPSHCTELPALAAFYNEFKIRHLKSGMVLNFDK